MAKKAMTLWKWIKIVEECGATGVVECTKDFIADDNEYINEKNGWTKLKETEITVAVKVHDA